jgi:hypothetical protein
MLGKPLGRTFISYSRKDGAEFAHNLRQSLESENLSVWQDIVTLEGGRDWWSQIEDALKSKSLQHFVLVVTPAALESPVVRREIRLARQEGKTVCPVKGPGLGDLGKLPRWLGQIYNLDLPEHQTTLIRVLQDESRQKRVAMMAPEPPADFVKRPKEFDTLKSSCSTPRAMLSPSPPRCVAPVATARRRWPRPLPMTPTFRMLTSTAFSGPNSARSREPPLDRLRPHYATDR